MGAREDTKISRAMLSNISSRQRSMWIMFLRFKINPKIAIRYSTSARIMTIKFSLTNLCGQTYVMFVTLHSRGLFLATRKNQLFRLESEREREREIFEGIAVNIAPPSDAMWGGIGTCGSSYKLRL